MVGMEYPWPHHPGKERSTRATLETERQERIRVRISEEMRRFWNLKNHRENM